MINIILSLQERTQRASKKCWEDHCEKEVWAFGIIDSSFDGLINRLNMEEYDEEELKKRRPLNFLAMVITLLFIFLTFSLLNQ